MRDLKSNINVVHSIRPQSLAAAVNGAGVDLRGCDGATVVFDTGAIGGTTPSFTFAVQESDDDIAYAPVAATDLQGAAPVVTESNAGVVATGYLGNKRYIRAAAPTVSGTSPTLLASAIVIRGHLALKGAV
jgi:hypothetical protein